MTQQQLADKRNVTAKAISETVISCCGIVLPALEAETEDDAHHLCVEQVEDEYYVTIPQDYLEDQVPNTVMVE